MEAKRKVRFFDGPISGGVGEAASGGSRSPLDRRTLINRTLLFALGVFLGYLVLAFLFRSQLRSAGIWLGTHFGFAGVGVFVYLVDTFIVPATADIVFPFTLDWNPYLLLGVMGTASAAGGFTGYWIARLFSHIPWIHRLTDSYRERGEALIRRYGAWAVVAAGLTPIPYSTVCWISGMLRVPSLQVFVAGFSRLPRMVIYYLLIRGGFVIIERAAVVH